MPLERLGVHESTSIDFPFGVFRDALADLDAEVVPVDGDGAPTNCDAFVTFTHQSALFAAEPAWIHTTLAGVDEFPLAEYEARDVALTNSTGLHGTSVGETTVGLMLTLARRLHTFVERQTAHEWRFPDWDETFTIEGSSVCVVGLGTVGRAVATRAADLGMTVTGVRRSAGLVPGVEAVSPPERLVEAIRDVEFVVLAVPLTEETRHLMGADELAAMRDDAYLVNVARGGVVDQVALVEALRAGDVAGAALDVFETEPLPADSPLWDMDDVVVTPHAAAANCEFYADVAALVAENVRQFEAGEPLSNRVV